MSPPTSRRSHRSAVVCLVVAATLLAAEAGTRAIADDLPAPAAWGNPVADLKVEQVHHVPEVELVFAGSSIVNAGLDPDLIAGHLDGGRAYNAALPGSPPEQWPVWYGDVVVPELRPETVVIGISVRDLNAATVDPDADAELRGSRGFRRLSGELDLLERLDDEVSRRSAIVRHRAALRRPGSVWTWLRGGEVDGWPRLVIDGGGRFLGFDDDPTHAPDADRLAALRRGVLRDYTAGGGRAAALEELVRRLDAAEVDVVLVRMPAMTRALVDGGVVPHGEVRRFGELLEDVADRYGAALFDASALDDRPELFVDEYHLSADGVAVVSSWLARQLEASARGISP